MKYIHRIILVSLSGLLCKQIVSISDSDRENCHIQIYQAYSHLHAIRNDESPWENSLVEARKNALQVCVSEFGTGFLSQCSRVLQVPSLASDKLAERDCLRGARAAATKVGDHTVAEKITIEIIRAEIDAKTSCLNKPYITIPATAFLTLLLHTHVLPAVVQLYSNTSRE